MCLSSGPSPYATSGGGSGGGQYFSTGTSRSVDYGEWYYSSSCGCNLLRYLGRVQLAYGVNLNGRQVQVTGYWINQDGAGYQPGASWTCAGSSSCGSNWVPSSNLNDSGYIWTNGTYNVSINWSWGHPEFPNQRWVSGWTSEHIYCDTYFTFPCYMTGS